MATSTKLKENLKPFIGFSSISCPTRQTKSLFDVGKRFISSWL
ncbi:hypothetical protein N44_03027 [Microcystis aeruginosa NIES-44]|uniref:Uncharacterized protein n=1 Tax=Microcystis aeruginosa NIES-44 TaxID=449439 RepID=A0A0A1VXD9_MICAE|nr:hypothetical protein N44_03027 [Microcystis aeruginosa NIES-44]